MPQCKKCGAGLSVDDLFCGECGAPAPKEPEPLPNSCPRCQVPITPEDDFCGECGHRLKGESPPVERSAQTAGPSVPRPTSPPAAEPLGGRPRPFEQTSPQVPPPPHPSSPPRRPQAPPFEAPARLTPFEQPEPQPKHRRGPLWIALGILAAAALIIAGYFGYKTLAQKRFEKRVESALAQDHIFDPPGDCVSDLLAAEQAKNSTSTSLARVAPKVRAKIEPQATADLRRWYKDSDSTVRWDNLEMEYGLLNSLFPTDNEIAAAYAYARAQRALAEKKYDLARQLYEEALTKNANWALALNGLAKVYIRTDSPLKDEARAIGLYQRAIQADPQFTWAYVNLAAYYRQQHDLVSAKEYLSKGLATSPERTTLLKAMGDVAFDKGEFQESQSYYLRALALETDPSNLRTLQATLALAAAWYRKSAEQGNGDAQACLGFCYATGQGVPQDPTQAAVWFRKAAEQGNSRGQNGLGVCLVTGDGVPREYGEAVSWFRKAAEQNNSDAQLNLGICYSKGEGVPQDYAQAVAWYRKAAEQNNPDAQFNLGISYDKGEGVPQDHAQAIAWYRRAAEQGQQSAKEWLAKLEGQ